MAPIVNDNDPKRESVVQRKEILRQFILPYTLKGLKIDPRVEMLLKRY